MNTSIKKVNIQVRLVTVQIIVKAENEQQESVVAQIYSRSQLRKVASKFAVIFGDYIYIYNICYNIHLSVVWFTFDFLQYSTI